MVSYIIGHPVCMHIYSRAMKMQHLNVQRYLKDILNILSQRISGDFMSTNDRHDIGFISFNVRMFIRMRTSHP